MHIFNFLFIKINGKEGLGIPDFITKEMLKIAQSRGRQN